jgi:hypothetical protein
MIVRSPCLVSFMVFTLSACTEASRQKAPVEATKGARAEEISDWPVEAEVVAWAALVPQAPPVRMPPSPPTAR